MDRNEKFCLKKHQYNLRSDLDIDPNLYKIEYGSAPTDPDPQQNVGTENVKQNWSQKEKKEQRNNSLTHLGCT